uniref:Uncharacterized protein n=1 Tax=Eutreptiella gymnastica TaxID=73025 RepID=A0A7S1IEP0_9EUGL
MCSYQPVKTTQLHLLTHPPHLQETSQCLPQPWFSPSSPHFASHPNSPVTQPSSLGPEAHHPISGSFTLERHCHESINHMWHTPVMKSEHPILWNLHSVQRQ